MNECKHGKMFCCTCRYAGSVNKNSRVNLRSDFSPFFYQEA